MRFIALILILLAPAAAIAASTDPVASGAQSDFELVLRDPGHPDATDPVAQGEYRRYPLSDLVDSIFAGPGGGGGGVTDHGNLSGLGDDDHPQYFNSIRGDARYSLTGHGHTTLPTSSQKAAMDGAASPSASNVFATMNDIGTGGGGGVTDHGALTGLGDDDHPQYYNQARGDGRYSLLDHGHVIGGVTGLQGALDGKASSGHDHAGTYEPASSNIQSHIGATGNAHGMTAVQVVNLIRGYFPEWCPPVKQTGQPSLDAELTARLAEIGCLPEDVLWVEGAEPGAPPGETDTTGPTGSISIAGGAQYTTSGTVSLTLSATDPAGVDQMQFSNTGSSYSTAEAYATSKASWSLTAGDGTKTVYAKFKDTLGNWSGAYSDTIVRDGTAPTSSATPAGGTYTSAQSVTLSGSDATSGLAAIQYTTDGSTPTTGSTTYSSPIEIAANTTLKFLARDNAGNEQAVQTQTYTINAVTDTTAPTVDTFTVGSPNDLLPITAFTASDDTGVTGYLVTESSAQPSAAAVNLSPAPTSYTTASYGTKSLYPWARDAAGNVSSAFGSPRSVDFVQAAPDTPTGLNATGGSGEIVVAWDSVSGADTYDLQVSDDNVTYSDLSMAQAGTGYTHDGLGDEVTKWYKVRATNEAGSSAYSAAVSGTTDAAGLPDISTFESGNDGWTVYNGGLAQVWDPPHGRTNTQAHDGSWSMSLHGTWDGADTCASGHIEKTLDVATGDITLWAKGAGAAIIQVYRNGVKIHESTGGTSWNQKTIPVSGGAGVAIRVKYNFAEDDGGFVDDIIIPVQ